MWVIEIPTGAAGDPVMAAVEAVAGMDDVRNPPGKIVCTGSHAQVNALLAALGRRGARYGYRHDYTCSEREQVIAELWHDVPLITDDDETRDDMIAELADLGVITLSQRAG